MSRTIKDNKYKIIRKKLPVRSDYCMDDIKYNRDKQKQLQKYIIQSELEDDIEDFEDD